MRVRAAVRAEAACAETARAEVASDRKMSSRLSWRRLQGRLPRRTPHPEPAHLELPYPKQASP